MTKKLDMLLGPQSPQELPAAKDASTPESKPMTEVIKVKTEKPKAKKTEEAAPTEKKVTTEKKTVIEDVKKEDENGWFSFLKDFGF